MRHANTDVLYFPTGQKKNRARILKSLSILEKMHPDDTNVFASNVIDRNKNRPDHLHSMCVADFTSSYVTKKADDVPIEPDEIQSYTVQVSNINDVKHNPDIIVLKNVHGEMQKRSQPYLFVFTKCPN